MLGAFPVLTELFCSSDRSGSRAELQTTLKALSRVTRLVDSPRGRSLAFHRIGCALVDWCPTLLVSVGLEERTFTLFSLGLRAVIQRQSVLDVEDYRTLGAELLYHIDRIRASMESARRVQAINAPTFFPSALCDQPGQCADRWGALWDRWRMVWVTERLSLRGRHVGVGLYLLNATAVNEERVCTQCMDGMLEAHRNTSLDIVYTTMEKEISLLHAYFIWDEE